MKILFIAPSLPLNNGSGGSIRSFQLYQEIKSFACTDVLTANSSGISFPLLREFRKTNRHVGHMQIPWKQGFFELRRRLQKEIKAILIENKYDYIFVRYYNTAYWLGLIGIDNLIIDCDDCNLELQEQEQFNNKNLFEKFLNKISRFNYIRNLSFATFVLFSKKSEKTEWKDNFYIAPNKFGYIHIDEKILSAGSSPINILFIGVLNYAPNFEGLDFFITNVWPDVIDNQPDAHLKIVGTGLSAHYRRKWSEFKNITICGFVENIDTAYEDIDFSIAPVYKGSGTHIKVMESLMRSKPMVISRLAHRGYENTIKDGSGLFVVNSVNDFSAKVILLIRDGKLRRDMGIAGRNLVLEHHTFGRGPSLIKGLLLQSESLVSKSDDDLVSII